MAQRFPSLPAAVPSRCLCSFTLCLHLGLDFHPHPACLPPRVLLALQCSASMLPPPGGSSQAVPTQGPPALRTPGSPRRHRRRELPISARGRWLWAARPWAVSLRSALRPPVRVVNPAALLPPSKKGPCPWTEGAMLCGPGRPGPSPSILSPRPRQGSPGERRAAGCAHPHRGRRQRPTAWQPRWGPSLFQRRRQPRLPRRRLFGACSFLPSDGAHAPPVACRETHGFFPVLGIPLGSGEHGGLGSERPPNPLER